MSSRSDFNIVELNDIENGKKFGIKLSIPMSVGWIYDVELIIDDDNRNYSIPLKHYENDESNAYFIGEVSLYTRALYHYYFKYKVGNQTRYIDKDKSYEKQYITKNEMNKISVNYSTPEWTQGKIMYHVFVDRFNKGRKETLEPMPRRKIHENWDEDVIIGPDSEGIWNNDFYGGDLRGIIDKLDYIKSYGTDIIYLSPIVYSQSNHRYDTSDYEQIDPYVGNKDDLKELCDKAHEKGMKIVLDSVFNHTGSDSKYFNQFQNKSWIQIEKDRGAYNDPNSKFAPFYKKEYDYCGKPIGYKYWWGMKNLPVCDGNSKQWQEYITGENGIIDQWFKCGIDGLRLDVADDLTDHYIELIRRAVNRNKKDGFILGEVWKNPMYTNRGYISDGNKMDSVMGYNFVSSLIKYIRKGEADQLQQKLIEIKESYPKDAILSSMNFTSTHDITRGINLWTDKLFQENGEWPWNLRDSSNDFCQQYHMSKEEYQRAKEIYKTFVYTLTFMPGILSIFYGDEAGLEGIGNLANRRPFPWNKEDKDLQQFFRYMGKIRKQEQFLEKANIDIVDINDKILMFERKSPENEMLVAVNRTDDSENIILPREYEDKPKIYQLRKNNGCEILPHSGLTIKK